MKAYLGCDIGKTRTENQDSIRAENFPDGVFAVVCDGMGGMQNGSAASKIAVSAAEERFRSEYSTGMEPEAVCELLRSCAADANQKVYQAAVYSEMRARMGTTLVGVFARDDVLCSVNVGDSRAYLLPAEGPLKQLTVDHTVVQLLFEQGMIREEERATHERRNELIRAVGVSGRVLADTQILPLQPGERVLLCSDGLYAMVPEARIAELIRKNPPEQLPELCIAEANANGGRDNISVILLTN
ncbi:MAG: protein phosphatase 2C domain-containing protein [Oscillospiraceae bacterium]|nr:serine/threonine-protein phosphatase [Oscillospiraceae bacterium]MCR4760315.1 protein phosphatase 2C domain-containing protein [Oscillospiraceae bacterium]